VTTQHDQRTYRDGPDGNTPIEAAGLNADQATLAGLCNDVADLADGVGNVGSGGNTTLRYVTGTTTDRAAVPPAIGTVFLNTTRKIPEWGWGTEWRNPDGTTISGAGASNAPQNAVAVVNSDNSIDVSASTVSGASTYNLYELRQTTPLATGLTTPSSHRTPGGTGTYGYSWTAVVGGVEGAASNIAYCSLPFGTTPDPGGGATGGGAIDTPSEILRLGAEGGHWSLDVGYASGNVSKSMSTIEAGWSDTPYFLPVESNTGVQFRVPMNGGTTPNSNYPRVELRERNADGSNASWNGRSGNHSLSGTTKVTHFPPNKQEVVVAQIHDTSGVSSTAIGDRLQVRVQGSNWTLSINGSELSTPILTGYSLGTYVAWSIAVNGTVVTVKLNGSTKYNATPSSWPTSGMYFKTGCYSQSSTASGNSSSEYESVVMQQNSLVLSHS
jgi:hypothetical protein